MTPRRAPPRSDPSTSTARSSPASTFVCPSAKSRATRERTSFLPAASTRPARTTRVAPLENATTPDAILDAQAVEQAIDRADHLIDRCTLHGSRHVDREHRRRRRPLALRPARRSPRSRRPDARARRRRASPTNGRARPSAQSAIPKVSRRRSEALAALRSASRRAHPRSRRSRPSASRAEAAAASPCSSPRSPRARRPTC